MGQRDAPRRTFARNPGAGALMSDRVLIVAMLGSLAALCALPHRCMGVREPEGSLLNTTATAETGTTIPKVIGQEVRPSDAVSDRIDIWAVEGGNAVIIELKRGTFKLQARRLTQADAEALIRDHGALPSGDVANGRTPPVRSSPVERPQSGGAARCESRRWTVAIGGKVHIWSQFVSPASIAPGRQTVSSVIQLHVNCRFSAEDGSQAGE